MENEKTVSPSIAARRLAAQRAENAPNVVAASLANVAAERLAALPSLACLSKCPGARRAW